MKNFIFAIATTLGLLTGCANIQPAVPAGYAGPVAIVRDSVKPISSSKVEMFYLQEVDGQRIESSRNRTERANQGAGFNMSAAMVSRNIPAKPLKLKIIARTLYAAPILSLTNDVYQVVGVVDLNPEPFKTYVVRGELGESYSAVWIEDETTGQAVAGKVEVRGSAKLGALEK